jgi:hypothetical protein
MAERGHTLKLNLSLNVSAVATSQDTFDPLSGEGAEPKPFIKMNARRVI